MQQTLCSEQATEKALFVSYSRDTCIESFPYGNIAAHACLSRERKFGKARAAHSYVSIANQQDCHILEITIKLGAALSELLNENSMSVDHFDFDLL
jgi:hypothetical protein